MNLLFVNKILAMAMGLFGVGAGISWLLTSSSEFGYGSLFFFISAFFFGLNAIRTNDDEAFDEEPSIGESILGELSSSRGVNPATGAPLLNSSTDVLGNPYGMNQD